MTFRRSGYRAGRIAICDNCCGIGTGLVQARTRMMNQLPLGWLVTTKVYSGTGADIVMESTILKTDHPVRVGQSSSSQLVQTPGFASYRSCRKIYRSAQ